MGKYLSGPQGFWSEKSSTSNWDSFYESRPRMTGNEWLIDRFEEAIAGFMEHRYAILDNFLPDHLWVQKLANRARWRLEQGDFANAGIGRGDEYSVVKAIRGDQIYWLEKESEFEGERYYMEVMDHFTDYLNRTCFTGIRFHEFHFAFYPPGTYYQRHLDRFQNDQSRLFSVVFYLNDQWKEADGGELVLYLPDQELVVQPLANRLAFFDSGLLEHEVRVAHRERLSITGWFRR